MPEGVRRDAFGDLCLIDVLPQDLPGTHPRERAAASTQEQNSLPFSPLQRRPKLAKVDGDCSDRPASDRHQTLLCPFAEDPDEMILQPHIANAERDPLRHAETGTIGHFEHRAIAKRKRLVERGGGQQALDLVNRQNLGQRAPPFRRFQAFTGVAHDVTFAEQKLEVRAHRRDVAADGGGGEAQILEVIDVLAQRARPDFAWRRSALYLLVGNEPLDVQLVRLACLYRRALLEGQEVVEPFNEEGA
jgi:hypothetical protein